MAIGDDLLALLGMMPTRDQTGAVTGNMSTGPAGGNAEGASLMANPPPMAPPAGPPMPPGMPAGPPPGPMMAQADPATTGSVRPQQANPMQPVAERTVSSTPAAMQGQALPGRDGPQGDLLSRYVQMVKEQEKQDAFMDALMYFGAMLPQSQQSRSALHSAAGRGGGGGGSSKMPSFHDMLQYQKQINDAETKAANDRQIYQGLIREGFSPERARAMVAAGQGADIFKPEELRKNAEFKEGNVRRDEAISEIMRAEKVDRARATAMYDSGNYKGYFDPKLPMERAGERRTEDLHGPKLRQETAAAGKAEFEVQNQGEAFRTEQAQKRANTAKLLQDSLEGADKLGRQASLMSRADEIAAESGIPGLTGEQVRDRIRTGETGIRELLTSIGPAPTARRQDWLKIQQGALAQNPDAKEGKDYISWEKYTQQESPKETKIDFGNKAIERTFESIDKDMSESAKTATTSSSQIANMAERQKLLQKPLNLGTFYSENLNEAMAATAPIYGMPEITTDTRKFVQLAKEDVLKDINALGSGSAISDADRRFLADISGAGYAIDANTLQTLLEVKARAQVLKAIDHNAKLAKQRKSLEDHLPADQKAHAGVLGRHQLDVNEDLIELGYAKSHLDLLRNNPNSDIVRQQFIKDYGSTAYKFFKDRFSQEVRP